MTDKQWEEKYWERRLRVAYFKQYRGILSEKTISDSADWLIDFVKPVISQEVKKERERIEKVVLDRKAGFKKTYRVADRHVFECVTEAVNHFLDDIIKEIRKDFPKE